MTSPTRPPHGCHEPTSLSDVATVDGKGDADHETRSRAAEPEHCRGDLVRVAERADRLGRLGLVMVEFTRAFMAESEPGR
jgi:hypothetical protein